MTRLRWFLLTIVVLFVANGAYHWWRGRGLITIHCEDWPPSKIVRAIERQGGVALRTNLPEDLKLRMHIDKVPLGEALETFATVAEARWRLTYVFAPKLPDAHTAAAGFVSGQRPKGWKQVYVPAFGSPADDDGILPDPRQDIWTVKTPGKADFQSYAQEAAQSVNAALTFPEAWNPPVARPPASGPIGAAAAALARAAGGRVLEVFLVERRGRDGDGPRGGGGPPFGEGFDGARFGRRGDGEGRGDRERQFSEADRERMRAMFEQRARAEIDKLPAGKREAALARFEERRKFFESLRDLPPDERRAKIEERLANDPSAQDRLDQRLSNRDARMSPDQRVERARGYVENKQAVRSGTP